MHTLIRTAAARPALRRQANTLTTAAASASSALSHAPTARRFSENHHSRSGSGSSSSSSRRRPLLAASVLLGSAASLYFASNMDTVSAGAAESKPAAGNATTAVSVPAHGSTQSLRNVSVSDLAALDFRTLGLEAPPPLPAHAPKWLHQLTADPGFQYRNLAALLDTSNHFLFDALSGERRLKEFYYFSEKVDLTPDQTSATEHEHPHLAPSLDFEPGTARLEKPGSHKPPHLVPNPAAANHNAVAVVPAPAAQATEVVASGAPKAFSSFNTDAPHILTATGPEVRAVFHAGRALCGHRGIVHGGMTAALMDDVSGAATFCAAGGGHFTANLNINYLKPIRADQYLLIRAQAVKQEGRKTYVNISVEDGRGEVFARGTALYVKPKMLPPAVMLAATH